MDTTGKVFNIVLFFEGKIFNVVVNQNKSFKFLLMKIAGELEIEDFERLREKYVLSYRTNKINYILDSELLSIIFSKEIKISNTNEIEIRLKLEDKKYLKPEKAPIIEDEVEVFRIELKKKIEIVETENKNYAHDLMEKNFKSKIEDKYSIFLNEINQRKISAFESKKYSYMLLDKMKTYLTDDSLDVDFVNNTKILERYKNEIKKYTYLDAGKYKSFIDKVEEKINDLIEFVSNLTDEYNFSSVVKLSEKKPEYPKELVIRENEDLLNHINENSKNGICVKNYIQNLNRQTLNQEEFRKEFNYYYKYSISNIKKIHLENFDFSKKNEKIILEDILIKILEHNNYKIHDLHINFYYGNLADFISKIVSIDKVSLTENSLKLKGLQHLEPFNKIKKIYVDPAITKEKNLMNRLMNVNCNFDKKLNIFSNSEYIDYSIFSNLENITIKFSSKLANLFNVSLSGNKLMELFIEDLNEDYKINSHDKNKFDFMLNKSNNIVNSNKRDLTNIKMNENNFTPLEILKRNKSIGDSINKSKLKSVAFKTEDENNKLIELKKFDSLNNTKKDSNEFFRFNMKQSNSNTANKSKSPDKNSLKNLTFSFSKKNANKTQISNYPIQTPINKKNNFFDVLMQNINIHEKFNSFASLKFLKFTNCLINSKFHISHCSNLKELYFDNCLFLKVNFDYFTSIEKLTFNTCFQKITMNNINFISEHYKNLNSFCLINPTDEFFDIIMKSKIFFNLKTIELYRIYQENYDELFKMILKLNAFDRIVFFPDYKRCDNKLLLIKFLDLVLKYNNKIQYLEFLVGLKFHPANIDRVKFFLRKLKYLKVIKLYMPKSEENAWKELFKDFKNLDWSIHTENDQNELLDYYVNE